MAFESINVGSAANDGSGDSLRAAGQKLNANFLEAINVAAKGAALGVASLDANSRVPHDVLGLAPVFNVKQYGAVGNGVTDDAAAIQAALNAANAAGGGVVYAPSGTYIITSVLTLATNVTLRGAGIDVTIVRQTTSNTGALRLNTDRSRAEYLTVQAPSLGSGNAVEWSGRQAVLDTVKVAGGAGQTGALIYAVNSFEMRGYDLHLDPYGGHGMLFDSTDATSFNYGDGTIVDLFVLARANNTVCCELRGETYAGNTKKTWNNMCFVHPVFTASTGLTGVVGLRLVNAQRNTVFHPNFEQMNTALDLQGQVGDGIETRHNQIKGGYIRDNVSINAGAWDNEVDVPRILGAITDVGVRNRVSFIDADFVHNDPVGRLQPTGTSQLIPVCTWLTNKTGVASVSGRVVKIGSLNNSFASVSAASDVDEWVGIVQDAGVADGTRARVAVAGVAQAYASASGQKGDYAQVQTDGTVRAVGKELGLSGSIIGIFLDSPVENTVAQVLITPRSGVTTRVDISQRFSDQMLTVQLRNQTAATIPKGIIVRAHATIEDAVQLPTVDSTGADWLAVAADAIPTLTNGQFAVAGTVPVLMTDAVALNDYVVVDTATATLGRGKTAGTTYPTTPGVLVGRCVKAAAAGALARVMLARA